MAEWQHPFPKSMITSRFGVTARRSSPHRGLDYATKANTIIPAVSKGTIKLIQWSDVLGWVVVQSAWDNTKKKAVYVAYCHLSCAKHGIKCAGPQALGNHSPLTSTVVGSKKEFGDPVGRMGNTGSASSGVHCHLTISPEIKGVFYGTVFDPEEFIDNMIKPEVCECCKKPL